MPCGLVAKCAMQDWAPIFWGLVKGELDLIFYVKEGIGLDAELLRFSFRLFVNLLW